MKYNSVLKCIFIIVICLCSLKYLSAEVEVYISEPSYQLVYNEDVTVSVNVSGLVQAMRSFEINVIYETYYLSADQSDLQEGDFLSNSGDETQWYLTGVDGNYTVTCAILGVTSGCTGSGTLFTLSLTNQNHDNLSGTVVSLSSVILKDILNNDISVDIIGNSNIQIDATPAYADFTLLLEGSYAGGSAMNHNLIDGGYIPTISPYDSENIGSLPNVSPHYIFDWIHIQLRITSDGSTVKSTNAFLLEDSSIVDVEGNSSLPLYYTTGNEYYIVILHRNHLSIMTAEKKTFGDNLGEATEIDLTDSTNIYGTDGIKELENGIYGMWAGDADNDGKVLTSDQADWKADFGVVPYGYHYTDMDLDGQVIAADQTIWKSNFGTAPYSQVPSQSRGTSLNPQVNLKNKSLLESK